ncbi:polysaccharide biosynthesis tyrosine autokinase [Curtobacterium sp. RRHDQ10]|uniref:polysaccharide biosynthesis tyrosine autokinase n=1 Tax=Curtobacterium phyllosphaerae TaxID=3413379 RepID=UPI003BF2559E
MDLDTLTRLLRRGWLLLAGFTLLGGAAGVGLTTIATPEYRASTSLYVAVKGATTSADLMQGGTAAEQKVQSFANVATSDRVLGPVIAELGLHTSSVDLARRVEAQTPIDSVLVTIAVTDESPTMATKIANAVGASLTKVVTTELEEPSADGSSPFAITTIQPAITPTAPASPRLTTNIAGGLAIGLLVGFALAALRLSLDTRLEERDEVESLGGAPAIGEIAFDKAARETPLVVHVDPASPRSEAFRRLRTNLQFLEVGREDRSFVVTSSVPSEGKSTTASNIAIALAESGARVALVDGDLRRPRVAELMGVEGEVGLTDVLIGRLELDDALQPWGRGGLVVLPSGQIPPNPTELLGSSAMEAVLRELETAFDVVIVDAPPLLPVTDAAILSTIAGGALLVAAMHRTTRRQLAAAAAALTDAGASAVGTVMTMVRSGRGSTYAYSYSYDAATGESVDRRRDVESPGRHLVDRVAVPTTAGGPR